jgi:threonine dehydrogenase-like Zn-dependent dehydrogenase
MPGGFAEYVKVGVSMLHRLPEEVSDEEAANIEPCAVSLRAVKGSALNVGNSVVIFGAGSIGLFALQLARLAGAGAVYVVEPAPGRAHAARALGADEVFDPGDPKVCRKVAKLTGEGAENKAADAGLF